MSKKRLDTLLAERGLFASRTAAAAAVMAGEVMLGRGRQKASQPGQSVDEEVEIALVEKSRYVSRGGIKLSNALATSGIEVADKQALDVGASTGGFTDCLLQEGVKEVTVVDVAYGELHNSLRNDDRVHVIERQNARTLSPELLPYAPSLIVIDVSFISLTKILGAVLGCAANEFECLAMVKPQFELERAKVGKNGVVRERELREEAVVSVANCAIEHGYGVHGFYSSGLPGPKGNQETFVYIARAPGILEITEAVKSAEL